LFERFTPEARSVIGGAQAESRRLRHNFLGVEHLLVGLLLERSSSAAGILGAVGVTVEGVRARLLELIPEGEDTPPAGAQVPFTPRTKKVLELSVREAVSDMAPVAPEHILLAIAVEGESVAIRVLGEAGVSSDQIRGAVLELLARPRPSVPARHRPVVDTRVRVERSIGIRVDLSPAVRRLLMGAAASALDGGRAEIETEDVLIALVRDAGVARLLAEAGIGEDVIQALIARLGRGQTPPEASATG
jgi:ATP-dependent Clp protease ATP-binding subunit ClpA